MAAPTPTYTLLNPSHTPHATAHYSPPIHVHRVDKEDEKPSLVYCVSIPHLILCPPPCNHSLGWGHNDPQIHDIILEYLVPDG